MSKERIKKIEEKIKKIKSRLNFTNNSCAGLQREEFESYEQDRMYLKILEEELSHLKR